MMMKKTSIISTLLIGILLSEVQQGSNAFVSTRMKPVSHLNTKVQSQNRLASPSQPQLLQHAENTIEMPREGGNWVSLLPRRQHSVYWDKPLLRGEFHRFGAILYPLVGALPLYLRAKTPQLAMYTLLFSAAVQGIMTVSGILHTSMWNSEKWHEVSQKADYAMIFVGIALLYSSIGKLLMGSAAVFGKIVEPLVWIFAAGGVLTKMFIHQAPHWVNALIFLVQGWACGPFIPLLFKTATTMEAVGLIVGGIFITLGASCFAFQWPKPGGQEKPDVFGPHEMFHVGTLLMFGSFWFTMWMRVAR